MSPTGGAVRKYVIDTTTQKVNTKLDANAAKHVEKVAATSARHAEALDRLAEHLETIDVWMRTDRGSRKRGFNRGDIAAAAMRIADHEGIEAVSMRRIAAELDAGTMTLYHYVRTKDELLTLVVDAFLGEVALPAGQRLPRQWRPAITLIARRTRDALRRHPWILDIADDPSIGPNAMRHFDQCLQAVASLDADLDDKIDLIMAVDEYVFGFCLHERNNLKDDVDSKEMTEYITALLDEDDYPALCGLVDEMGLERLWAKIHTHVRGSGRFDRNLTRLLAGFEASVVDRPSTRR